MKRAIKNQLSNGFHASYIDNLHDNHTGCNNISIQETLQHTYKNYGDMDESDLEANEKMITQDFDVTEPFSMLVKRMEDCMDLVEAAGAPCTDRKITNKVFSIIVNSYVFHDGVRE